MVGEGEKGQGSLPYLPQGLGTYTLVPGLPSNNNRTVLGIHAKCKKGYWQFDMSFSYRIFSRNN
jgi:hypothetical protein